MRRVPPDPAERPVAGRPVFAVVLAPVLAAVAAALVVLTTGCTPPATRLPGQGTVTDVVDGDTLDVAFGDTIERVRLIGIDTPETKHPGQPVECYGPEAAAFTASLVPPGTAVLVTRDRQARDVHGRLLGYVTRVADGLDVNAELLRGGYAEVLSIPPNTARADEYAALAREARIARSGRWGACPPGT